MAPTRSFRWLFLALAVTGLTVDLGSKYVIFHWLHHDGQPADDGPFKVWPNLRGEYDLVPGWFKLSAEFELANPPDSGVLGKLQTVSAPIMPRVNHGALFGIGGQHKWLANSVFATVSIIAAIAIFVWGTRTTARADRWLSLSLGLILGGTIGNFYDRVVFGGVRDFLYFYKVEWPVFNIADCCLVVGASVLLIQALFAPAPQETPQPASA